MFNGDVIVNAAAGAGEPEELRDSLAETFRAAGLDARVRVTRDGEEALEAARVAAADGAGALVIGGGDGTIGAVAALLAGKDKPLGVLPLGTYNHFAKDLGLPLDLDGASRVAAGGRVARVDVGEVNGRVFVNNRASDSTRASCAGGCGSRSAWGAAS